MYIILLFIKVYRATLSTFYPYRHKKRPPLTWQPCVLVDAFHLVDRKVILFGQLQELGHGLAGTVLADEQLAHSSFRVEGAATNKRRGVGTIGATSRDGVICGDFPLQFIVGNVQACAGFLRLDMDYFLNE